MLPRAHVDAPPGRVDRDLFGRDRLPAVGCPEGRGGRRTHPARMATHRAQLGDPHASPEPGPAGAGRRSRPVRARISAMIARTMITGSPTIASQITTVARPCPI